MKWSRHMVLLGSAALMAGAGLWVGCSDDSTTTPGNDAGTDATSNPDTGGNKDSGSDTGTPTDGGTDGGGTDAAKEAGLPTNCTEYCTLVQATCGAGAPNGQYGSQSICEKMCAKFPAGDAGATTGNSFACRSYHALAASQGNAALHCFHAGPYGFGGCGSENENFCFMYNAQCTGGGGYTNVCSTVFGTKNDTTDGGTFLTGNGAKDCREYHLENAYDSNQTTGGHCDHASNTGGGVCP